MSGDGIEFDFTEVTQLVADLTRAPRIAVENVNKAIEVTAVKVKRDWQEPLKGSATVPGGAASVSYDIKGAAGLTGSAISAEIGPTLAGQGPIVGMLEYGTPTTGPRGYGAAALQKNEADFIKGIQIAGDVL